MGLCLRLGGMTFAEFIERIEAPEIIKWAAYFELEAEEEEWRRQKEGIRGRR